MENSNLNLTKVRDTFDTTRQWVQMRRRVLQFNTIVLLIILSVILSIMAIGAGIQAFSAAHLPFLLTAPLPSILVSITALLPVVGFVGLLIFSYFTNLSQQDDSRRELVVDGIVLGMAILIPQVIFHAVWLATTYFIVTSRNYIVTTDMFMNINLHWVLAVVIGIASFVLTWFLRRTLIEPTVVDNSNIYEDEIDYNRQGENNYSRRAYE